MTESGAVATSREGTAGIGDAKTAHLFTSESVTEGHPDKIADQTSDTILTRPVSDMAGILDSEDVDMSTLHALVEKHFDLRPGATIHELRLRRPIYAATAAYGHVGRHEAGFAWERTDRADALRRAAGL
jgi:S-adenosylmethionine synthetase